MITLNEYKKWFEDLEEIIFDLNIAITNAKELDSNSDNEYIESFKRHPFFVHHKFQLRFIMVIQLDKIFSKSTNQKRRINALLGKLMTEEFDCDFCNQLTKNKMIPKIVFENKMIPRVFENKNDINIELKKYSQRLKENQKPITKINNARNKIYAHSDPELETDILIPFIEINEFEKLINLANDFYDIFYGRLFGISNSFRTPDWDLKYLFKSIAKNYEILGKL